MKVNNRVQSLLLNYHFALFSGDFTLVYYQMGELEYIRTTNSMEMLSWHYDIQILKPDTFQCVQDHFLQGA